eukprot:gi/632986554/ref/XP_007910303.1/ PREDICTED: interleukin-18 [Callorhinchus milii]
MSDPRNANATGCKANLWQKYDGMQHSQGFKILKNKSGLIPPWDGIAEQVAHTEDDGIKFSLVRYRQMDASLVKGFPVAIQVHVSEKVYHICCDKEENRKVLKFKEGMAPTGVVYEMRNIIFYRRQFEGRYCKFESACESGWFLCTEQTDGQYKMALKKPEREVDETLVVSVD